jgi:hypothetical protein
MTNGRYIVEGQGFASVSNPYVWTTQAPRAACSFFACMSWGTVRETWLSDPRRLRAVVVFGARASEAEEEGTEGGS